MVMSCVPKPSRRLIHALDNANLNDSSSTSAHSDSESDSSRSRSSSSEEISEDDTLTWGASQSQHEEHASSSEDEEPTQKWHMTRPVTGDTASRVRKTQGPSKKNKSAGRLQWLRHWSYSLSDNIYIIVHSNTPKWSITYHLSIFSSMQMAKLKTKWNPKSDFFWPDEDNKWDMMKPQVTVFGQVLDQTSYSVSIKFQVTGSLPALNIDGIWRGISTPTIPSFYS